MFNSKAYALGANRSCIRELFEYGRSRAAVVGEENVLDFSLGNPSIPAPQAVEEAIREILRETPSVEVHGYTPAGGDMAARDAIARELNRRYDWDVTPQELFLGCGAAPELIAVFRALAVPGGKILAIAPYFPEYAPFVEESGLEFGAVPAQEPDFQIDMEALEALVTKNTQAVIVNSPNNPSGVVYSRETLQKLGALLEEKSREYGHPIYIVSDEPYRELVYDGTEVPFVPAIYRDTIICYSYSKSLSLPGERIGYIYVPRKATDGAALYAAVAGAARSIGHVCAPSLFQKVIARCTQIPPDLNSYDKNRRTLYEGLVAAGYQVAKPQGAFYLFVKAPEGDGEAFSQRAKEKDLLIVPGKDFGCPGYCRLCYCVPYEKIQKSIPIFRELIGKTH